MENCWSKVRTSLWGESQSLVGMELKPVAAGSCSTFIKKYKHDANVMIGGQIVSSCPQ